MSSTRTSIIVILPLKSINDDQISEMLSLNFTAIDFLSDVLCLFLVCELRSGDKTAVGEKTLASARTITTFDRDPLLFLHARVHEIIQLK